EVVDGVEGDAVGAAQVEAQSQVAQQDHRLLRADEAGGAEDAQGPLDLIVEGLRVIVHELVAGDAFILDDPRENVIAEVFDDLLLAAAEGDLVGDLEEVADGLGTLTEEAADGE